MENIINKTGSTLIITYTNDTLSLKSLLSNTDFNNQNAIDYHSASLYIYTILTPIIIFLGIVGNVICLQVSVARRLVRQASSQYFFVFCLCDLLVLIFYVLPEWLERGLYPLTHVTLFRLNALPGICQVFLFLSYWLRFLSIWLLVTYSIERYLNLKNPFFRKRTCHWWSNSRIVICIATFTTFISIWKTISSAVVSTGNGKSYLCSYRRQQELHHFIYDTIYAALISIIPSILIIVFNGLIARHLFIWRKSRNPDTCLSHQELIGFQFAGLLVIIAFCFLILTWPYYICWLHDWFIHYSFITQFKTTSQLPQINQTNLISSDMLNFVFNSINQTTFNSFATISSFKTLQSQLYRWELSSQFKLIARIIFYCHFGINFFLYTFTSRYFRAELKRLFTLRSMRRKARQYYTEDFMVEKRLLVQSKPCYDIEYEINEERNKVRFLGNDFSLHTI